MARRYLEKHGIKTQMQDLGEPSGVTELAGRYDMVLNAVPGFMGYKTLEAIIKSGKNVVDIAFFPEDPFQLDDLAKKHGVTAVVDCGVSPGMSNVLIGQAFRQLDKTENILFADGKSGSCRQIQRPIPALFQCNYTGRRLCQAHCWYCAYEKPGRCMDAGCRPDGANRRTD